MLKFLFSNGEHISINKHSHFNTQITRLNLTSQTPGQWKHFLCTSFQVLVNFYFFTFCFFTFQAFDILEILFTSFLFYNDAVITVEIAPFELFSGFNTFQALTSMGLWRSRNTNLLAEAGVQIFFTKTSFFRK